MHAIEQKKIDDWIDACQKLQPEASLAIFIYIRDGYVQIGRRGQPLESKRFLVDDLPVAGTLIEAALKQAFDRGPTDAETPNVKHIPLGV